MFNDEYDRPGFKIEGEHEITENDFPISEEHYNLFFELQSQGISLRIKNPNGKEFWDIFEAYTPEVPEEILSEIEQEQIKEQKIQELEKQISELRDIVKSLLNRQEAVK